MGRKIAVLGLLTGMWGGLLHAGTVFTVYNTGVDNTPTILSDGSVDSHYTVNSGTAYAIQAPKGILFTIWVADQADSQWISPQTDPNVGVPGGTYDYVTTFDLTGLDPATATLTGNYSADDSVSIILNGSPTGQSYASPAWASLSSFSITSGFISGVNTIDFQVTNSNGSGNNPSGVQVEFLTHTADPLSSTPEPGSYLLLSTGIAGLWWLRGRRSS